MKIREKIREAVKRFSEKPPELIESLIPFWGSFRQGACEIRNDKHIKGIAYLLLGFSDIFIFRLIPTKGLLKVGSSTWPATRRWLGVSWKIRKGAHVHHWLIRRNSLIGKRVPDFIKNQPWNLMVVNKTVHKVIHGKKATLFFRAWLGVPGLCKRAITNTAGKLGMMFKIEIRNV